MNRLLPCFLSGELVRVDSCKGGSNSDLVICEELSWGAVLLYPSVWNLVGLGLRCPCVSLYSLVYEDLLVRLGDLLFE